MRLRYGVEYIIYKTRRVEETPLEYDYEVIRHTAK